MMRSDTFHGSRSLQMRLGKRGGLGHLASKCIAAAKKVKSSLSPTLQSIILDNREHESKSAGVRHAAHQAQERAETAVAVFVSSGSTRGGCAGNHVNGAVEEPAASIPMDGSFNESASSARETILSKNRHCSIKSSSSGLSQMLSMTSDDTDNETMSFIEPRDFLCLNESAIDGEDDLKVSQVEAFVFSPLATCPEITGPVAQVTKLATRHFSPKDASLSSACQRYSPIYGDLFAVAKGDEESSTSSSESSGSDLDLLATPAVPSPSRPLPALPMDKGPADFYHEHKYFFTKLYTVYEAPDSSDEGRLIGVFGGVDADFKFATRKAVEARIALESPKNERETRAGDGAKDPYDGIPLKSPEYEREIGQDEDAESFVSNPFDLEEELTVTKMPAPSPYEIACRQAGGFPVFKAHQEEFNFSPIPCKSVTLETWFDQRRNLYRARLSNIPEEGAFVLAPGHCGALSSPAVEVALDQTRSGNTLTAKQTTAEYKCTGAEVNSECFSSGEQERPPKDDKPMWEKDFFFTSIGNPDAPRWADDDDDEEW
ncbi:hypothetical protein QBC43DRAFT_293199 [Cladorrhinum sp. PSN259]|nr:hypothetical protein QBC43DRAFT_293199 [Cladorrhinum sp. PSN259]